MPLSKKRNRERMRLKRGSKASEPVVLPRRLVRALRAAGIDPEKVSASPAVSEEAFKDLLRTLDAKEQRIAWQSSGIKLLHSDVATLKATVSMLQVQLQQGDGSRLTQLEADLALLTAQLRDVAV